MQSKRITTLYELAEKEVKTKNCDHMIESNTLTGQSLLESKYGISNQTKMTVSAKTETLIDYVGYIPRHGSALTFLCSNGDITIEFFQEIIFEIIEASINLQSKKYNASSKPFKHNIKINSKNERSMLTKLMKKQQLINEHNSKNVALLPYISQNNPSYQRLKVYFFETPQFTILSISREHRISELISHIIALSDVDPQVGTYFNESLPKKIKGNYKDPELYEMRLLEDEDDPKSGHIPCIEGEKMNITKNIGSFLVSAAAFCRTKEYKQLLSKYSKGI